MAVSSPWQMIPGCLPHANSRLAESVVHQLSRAFHIWWWTQMDVVALHIAMPAQDPVLLQDMPLCLAADGAQMAPLTCSPAAQRQACMQLWSRTPWVSGELSPRMQRLCKLGQRLLTQIRGASLTHLSPWCQTPL